MSRVTLGEAFILNPTVKLPKGAPAPFIDMASLVPFTRDVSASHHKPYGGGMKFCDGDVLMARITPSLENGKTSIYRAAADQKNAPAFGSTEFIVIRGREGTSSSSFAYYLFTSPAVRDYSISSMNGSSGRQRVQLDSLASFEIDLPELQEQRAIAATLGALDDKIESNRRTVMTISNLIDASSEKNSIDLPSVPLGEIAATIKESVNPSKLGDVTVDHFSLPAFDSGARPERVAASTIMSNKLKVPKCAILVSRLNPRFNRTWWASVGTETSALASTEFLVLTSEDALELAAVWLAVRDSFFREELPKRVTGTSGSHQRVRPDDVLAIEVPDFRGASLKVKQSTLGLLMRAESLRIESDRLTALRDVLLPELLSGRMQVPVGGVAS